MSLEEIVGTDDVECVNAWRKMPRARVLLDHLSAFDTTLRLGGLRCIESPMDQSLTWRRVFCFEYSRNSNPFQMPLVGDKLPKVIAICQLSGQDFVFYCDSVTLVKVLCLTAQEVSARIVKGVDAVLEKADTLESTVLLTFCLPFQAGLDRIFWEIRTLRKASTGAVKDGEAAFACNDAEAKSVPCTRSLEHWDKSFLDQLAKIMQSKSTFVCLDAVKEPESGAKTMDKKALEGLVDMLKTDRKRLLDQHNIELKKLVESHQKESQILIDRAENAEQDASIRIAKVAHASKKAEEVVRKKEEQTKTQMLTIQRQLADLQTLQNSTTIDLNAAQLRADEETNKSNARQKVLESQVNAMKSSITKSTAEWAKKRKDLEESERLQKRCSDRKIEELERIVRTKVAALNAIEASANEARRMLCDAEAKKKAMETSEATLLQKIKLGKNELNLYKILLRFGASRMLELQEQQTEGKRAELCVGVEKIAEIQDELKQTQKELSRKEHLVSEHEKRVKFLERSLQDSDRENKELKELKSSTSETKRCDDMPTVQHVHCQNNVCQPDANLDHITSSLYNSLNLLTNIAYYSNSNARNVCILKAKLDALTTQQHYY